MKCWSENAGNMEKSMEKNNGGRRLSGREKVEGLLQNLKFWHIFFWGILIVSLVPLAIISFFNHASADDYAFSNYPHHAWEATGSLLAFFRGCLKQLHWSYTSWQGCFTAVLLGTLDPVAFGDSWYAVVAFLTIGTLIISNLIFWRTLFAGGLPDRQVQREQRMLADIAACITSTVMIQLVPRALDMFFWWDGSVNYLPFFAAVLLLSAALIKMLRGEKTAPWKIVLTGILSFLSMGGNYVTALVNLLIFFIFGLVLTFLRRRGWVSYLVVLVSGMAGLLVSVLAPGNAVRMEQEGSTGPGLAIATIKVSIVLAGQSIQEQTGVLFFLLMSLLIPVFVLVLQAWDEDGVPRFSSRTVEPGTVSVNSDDVTDRVRSIWTLPAVPVFLALFLIYAASYAPTVYVYGDGGPMRVEDVRFFYLVILGAVAEFFLTGKLYFILHCSKETGEDQGTCKVRSGMFRWFSSVLVMIVLFVGMYYVIPRQNREALTSICAARSLMIGEAQRYDLEMMERSEILNDPETDGQDVTVAAVSERPYLLFLYGLELTEDPDYWINQTVAEYCDKKSVTLEGQEAAASQSSR